MEILDFRDILDSENIQEFLEMLDFAEIPSRPPRPSSGTPTAHRPTIERSSYRSAALLPLSCCPVHALVRSLFGLQLAGNEAGYAMGTIGWRE